MFPRYHLCSCAVRIRRTVCPCTEDLHQALIRLPYASGNLHPPLSLKLSAADFFSVRTLLRTTPPERPVKLQINIAYELRGCQGKTYYSIVTKAPESTVKGRSPKTPPLTYNLMVYTGLPVTGAELNNALQCYSSLSLAGASIEMTA